MGPLDSGSCCGGLKRLSWLALTLLLLCGDFRLELGKKFDIVNMSTRLLGAVSSKRGSGKLCFSVVDGNENALASAGAFFSFSAASNNLADISPKRFFQLKSVNP